MRECYRHHRFNWPWCGGVCAFRCVSECQFCVGLVQGANAKLEGKEGHTARMLALKANHMMVVSLLDNAQYVHSYAEGEAHLVWVWWGGVGWGGVGCGTALLCGGHMCFTYPAAWDESGDETLDESEASDIMTGPKEFSRSYDPTQPSADVLARRRSSVQRTASPQIGKGSEVGQCAAYIKWG